MLRNFVFTFSKWLIGLLFIFSGLVKLIDPLGTQYKMEEYFGREVLNLEFLIPYALSISLLLIFLEILLGIALLLEFHLKKTILCLLGLTLFFLFLTWYAAYYEKVTDCGCFGEVLKLSPWQTFYKNIVFLFFIILLGVIQNSNRPTPSSLSKSLVLGLATLTCFFLAFYTLQNLPIVDFSAYAPHKNIRKGMQYTNKYEIPPIHDFYLISDSDDLTEKILSAPKVLLIVTNDLKKCDATIWKTLNTFALQAKQKGYMVYGLSGSSSQLVQYTTQQQQLPYEMLFCDGTTLKTMMRNDAGIVILNHATIVEKQSWNNLQKIKL